MIPALFAAALVVTPAQDLSPAQRYVRALAVMQSLPEPRYLTYQSIFSSPQMGIQLAPYAGYGALYLTLDAGPSAAAWRTQYAGAATRITLETDNGVKLAALSPIFNPTWQGAYAWLRYGLQGPPAPKPQMPESDGDLKTIALVSALSPGAYDVEDGGAQTCPAGAPGEHLRLHARFEPARHPVTDVVVESSSDRICSMRFHVGSSGLVYTMTGWIQLDFRQIDGYWLVGGGQGDIGMQFFGETYRHAPIAFRYSAIAFEPPKAPMRPAMFTAALFHHDAVRASSPPPSRVAAVQEQQPLKTIEHARASAICTTLHENVLRALTGLRTNDAIAAQLTSAVRDLSNAYASNTHFSRGANDRASVAQFAGKNDADPGLAAAQLNLSRYVDQIHRNLELIHQTLNDPKVFPSPAATQSDKEAADLKAKLLTIAQQQEALLNAASGMNDTLSMQQMIAQGDGTLGATNEPAGIPGRGANRITGVGQQAVSFGDPLDEMNPSQRSGDPSLGAGRVGSGLQPQESAAPRTTQAPSDLANNPLTRLYAGALQNESAAEQDAAALAKAVGVAASACSPGG